MPDSFIQTAKTRDYSIIANPCLRDPKLSARAKGIYAYLMTLPSDWKLYMKELRRHFKEGRDALQTAMHELEDAGYVTKETRRAGCRLDGWAYTVHETSQITESLETRHTENPSDGKPATTNYLLKPIIKTVETVEKGENLPLVDSASDLEKNEGRGVPPASNLGRGTPAPSSKQGGGASDRPKKIGRQKKKPASTRTPQAAPWAGRNYKGIARGDLSPIDSYEDIRNLCDYDPILAAMSVTGELLSGGYGFWIKWLNSCSEFVSVEESIAEFLHFLELTWGECRCDEIRNPAAIFNSKLKGFMEVPA